MKRYNLLSGIALASALYGGCGEHYSDQQKREALRQESKRRCIDESLQDMKEDVAEGHYFWVDASMGAITECAKAINIPLPQEARQLQKQAYNLCQQEQFQEQQESILREDTGDYMSFQEMGFLQHRYDLAHCLYEVGIEEMPPRDPDLRYEMYRYCVEQRIALVDLVLRKPEAHLQEYYDTSNVINVIKECAEEGGVPLPSEVDTISQRLEEKTFDKELEELYTALAAKDCSTADILSDNVEIRAEELGRVIPNMDQMKIDVYWVCAESYLFEAKKGVQAEIVIPQQWIYCQSVEDKLNDALAYARKAGRELAPHDVAEVEGMIKECKRKINLLKK